MKNINLTIGQVTKETLINSLNEHNIRINPLGEKLLKSKLIQVSNEKKNIQLTELSLHELGFENGANLLEIIKASQKIGLKVCPVEVAPFLRLNYQQTDTQGMVSMEKQFKTPEGAVTVVSEIIKDQVSFPKWFYLRKIDGELWLRGYVCDYEHIFESHERFILERQGINKEQL